MSNRGKKYIEAKQKIEAGKRYPVEEAVELVVGTATAKFDETVDAAIRLGRESGACRPDGPGFRGSPPWAGKNGSGAGFCQGRKEKEALEAGADVVGVG